jgi:eukaryotic-like serine/threonine-protein kinase
MACPDDGSPVLPDDTRTQGSPDDHAMRDRQVAGIAAGQVLAGRFRVRRFIARGGMGEVFEAEDLELHEDVALKTVRPEIAADPGSLERFKTEVHLARKVTHPSACRIFDVFRHQDRSGGPDVTFLTMELLRGETLATRLSRTGRMVPDEALPLIEQVAGALEAAHRAGVIHRDLKAANVMLVPRAPGSNDVRAVVTDFGLARRDPSVEGASIGVSTAGMVVGTPAYMAPEQIEGGTVTAATDVYALGVLMYEMVTGKLPFEADTPWAAMMKRLQHPPSSPRIHVSDLDPAWESVVLRCLEREPTKRFMTTGAVVRALRGRDTVREAAPPASASWRWLVPALAAGLVVIGGLFGLIGWWEARRSAGSAGPARAVAATTVVRRSVAVLGLRNLSGRSEVAWLAVALAEMLTSELGAGEAIRTISGESVARARAELTIDDFDSLARDTLDRVRARLGSDLLVLGSYTALGDKSGGQIRLDVRLQDTKLGEIVASVSETGTETALFDLVSRTGIRLREKLGIGVPTSVERESVRASLPQDPAAARLYADALARLRLFDTPGARDLLEKAKAKEPAHALTRAALARTWTLLGYDRRAEEEAKAAMDLAASLSREERLSIEGQYREAARQWDKAIEIHQSLFNFFPDNLEYGLRLATVQESGGKGKEAFDTLDALRRLPAPAGVDPRIDIAEAVTARYQSQSQRGVDAAARAAKAAAALHATYLLARAKLEEGSNLQNLGRMDEAATALAESERLFREAGDRRGVAAAMNNRGLVLLGRGDLDGTEKLWTEALAAYRAIGNKSGEALLVSNLGSIDYSRGNRAGARRRWEQTLPIYRELNEPEGEAMCLINIASVLGEQGDIRGARQMFEQARDLYQRIGHKSRVLTATGNIASCWHEEGDLAAAGRNYQQVMELWKETGDKDAAAPFVEKYGNLLRDQADVAGARRAYTDALTLRQQMKQEQQAAHARLALLSLDVDEGKARDAEPAVRQLLEVFQRLKQPDGEASARGLLAQVAAAQGRPVEAKSEAQQARSLVSKSERRELRLTLEIACARVLGVLSDADRSLALEILRKAQTDASRIGTVPLVFEARLALGEVEMRTRRAGAQASLRQLEQDANAKGFARVAALAAAASR